MTLPATIRYAKENYVNEMPLSWWEGHLVGCVIAKTISHMDSPILDLGCGMGVASVMCARSHAVVGLDISVLALSRAKCTIAEAGYGDHISLVRASADALPFRDGTFGGAYAFEFFEHIYRADQVCVQRGLQRILKVHAQLVATVPLGNNSDNGTHVMWFTCGRLRTLALLCSWHVRFCGLLPMPKGYGDGSVVGLVAQA